jgi:RNA polymerase sigma-70 factor (ECF subfamily)
VVAATMTMPTEAAADESEPWLRRLGAPAREGEAAVAELHALLLKAARFELGRRRGSLSHLRGGDHDDLAQQSADDALLALLGKLDEFRGESRFTTWAYRFALLEAEVKARRRAVTVTSALHGQIRDDPRTRQEFLALTGKSPG